MLMCPTHRICFEKGKFIIRYIPKVSPIHNWYKSHVYSFQDRLAGLSSWTVPRPFLSQSSIGEPLPSLSMMPLTLPCFKHTRWVSFNAALSLQTFLTTSQAAAFPGKTGLWKVACLTKLHKLLDVPTDQWHYNAHFHNHLVDSEMHL